MSPLHFSRPGGMPFSARRVPPLPGLLAADGSKTKQLWEQKNFY